MDGKDKGKEIIVAPMWYEGSISIQRNHYKESVYYDPAHVEIKHPNPTRDNGPLIVAEGEHCGKLVRRIHHRYDDSNMALLKVVVVQQVGNLLGELTREELEFKAESLCITTETKEQKQHLDSLVAEKRTTARKIRAKLLHAIIASIVLL